MVVTKVFQIKNANKLKQGVNYIDDKNKITEITENNLGEKIDYIIDKNKTEVENNLQKEYALDLYIDKNGHKEMVSCYGLASVESAYNEMRLTQKLASLIIGKGRKGEVLAHHIIQSFSPEDNLTPEQVHEIGRKTVLELTRGEHEFIIATHLDKEHLHNHIIFNTINNVTLKRFRWQKGTKKSLENISDKHADLFGAKIIEREKLLTHTKYEAYKKKNTYRYELKQKLNFLLRNTVSIDDFLEKAKVLNIDVQTNGAEIKYRLLDSEQIRNIRDRTLSKTGFYGIENIQKMTENNKVQLSKERLVELYEKLCQEKEEDFEMRFVIEPWQVQKETTRGIYLDVEFGLKSNGTILIPYNKIDKLQNGYEIFVKRNDYFYFLNAKNSQENRFIKGITLGKQLSLKNGETIIYKNYYIGKLDELIKEFNYLSKNDITEYAEFKEFQNKFYDQLNDVESELDRLDMRVAELNKLHTALLGKDGTQEQNEVSAEILTKLKIPVVVDKKEIEKLLHEVRLERELLRTKYNNIVAEHKYTKAIEENIEVRKNIRKM